MDIKDLMERALQYKELPKEEEEKAIHAMTQSNGWGVVRMRMEDRIRSLLTPFSFDEKTPMSVRGAIYEARFALAKALSEEISAIDTASNSYELRISQQEQKSEKGDEDI